MNFNLESIKSALTKNNVKGGLNGIIGGIFALIFSFGLIVYTINGIEEKSTQVAKLKNIPAIEVGTKRGMINMFGRLEATDLKSILLKKCTDPFCLTFTELFRKDNLIYYKVVLQRFEVVKEVTETSEAGTSNTETVEYSHEWVTKDTKEEWSTLSMAGIQIVPQKARVIADEESQDIREVHIAELTSLNSYGQSPKEDEPKFGTTRALVTYIPKDDREYTIIGEKRSGQISDGTPFIISDKSSTAIVEQLRSEEKTLRLGVRILAFVLMTIGFTSILNPVLSLTDLIPIAGNIARKVAFGISALISAVIVIATVVLLQYWWIILLVIILGIGAYFVLGASKGKAKASAVPGGAV